MILKVLGTSQDAGYPQVGCMEECCKIAWLDKSYVRYASCLALINQSTKKYWLFDVTPDIKIQIQMLKKYGCSLAGVFITHAHMGHYMGLVSFGLEAMNLSRIPVYVMPRMKSFIESNSIMQQLIQNQNIILFELEDQRVMNIDNSKIKPFNVPHRNELSETVGYQIMGKKNRVIYLPDIDSWDGWENKLNNLIESNDVLFIDGTFFSNEELKTRDITKVPHPTIIDTMSMLSDLNMKKKKKIYFIHYNHTNDVLRKSSNAVKSVIDNGFSLSKEMQTFKIS